MLASIREQGRLTVELAAATKPPAPNPARPPTGAGRLLAFARTRPKTCRCPDRVGGGVTPAVLSHHRTCGSASGGS
ncbi:MAG TPA: hypothetical protein ENJ19_08090 [Gammaproteobacteria bacterium]|nr:hypothetical protein [Gammaproteobacteria bacterium]